MDTNDSGGLQIRIASINPQTLRDLFAWCRACSYWERPDQFTKGKHTEEEARLKSEWFGKTAAHFDPCGKLLYADDEPAAYCQYAPPDCLPGISQYVELATCVDKDDKDGIFISCLHVPPAHQHKGLGRRLLQEVIDELKDRGFTTVETFARNDSANNCSGPTQFYLSQGFTVIATETYPDGSSFSLVRMVQ